MRELEYWIDKNFIKEMYSSDYWNDIENEKSKEWWIDNSSDKKVINFLKSEGLLEEFELAISESNIKGKIIDVAAGTCWTSALLSKIKTVSEIDVVEFSYHRISELAKLTIASLGGDLNKINRYLGSFYDIKKPDEHYDIVMLSQAYHHAEFPLKLFHECDRVLKKGGQMIIIGEHIIDYKRVFGRFIKNLFKFKFKFHIFSEYYNQNIDALGDHYYMEGDYRFTFNSYGYSFKSIKSPVRNSTIFIITKEK